ncbi:MAG: hypothetical protein MJ169_08925 [Treponema sp.]|nr:hypothetical protein [Treponema sp.]
MSRKESIYIAISEKQTIVLPLKDMAKKFGCSIENIIINSVRGSQKEAFGQKWTFDLAFVEEDI